MESMTDIELLERCNQNKAAAARYIGISYRRMVAWYKRGFVIREGRVYLCKTEVKGNFEDAIRTTYKWDEHYELAQQVLDQTDSLEEAARTLCDVDTIDERKVWLHRLERAISKGILTF
ncbi:homeodomain-like protein [Vibrio phage 1.188.A._10N.286.51.A6]|uniref:Homeodomain-like protein n=6 Tax=Mukerjeevirus TaxID=2733146 RepID=A0A2I7REG0_9CAUD|nr:homeodomain-like protein [Vibrio phage 1.169.O._10N.261.52.B1]YP_009817470.1 homeodomain-like protein [Vibrio phage 1.188.A._10N.286.51.A6]YP_009817612.1 homeodomain-like protein [Vibrio phage 1.224.A._10N.261.48.B1]YP_009817697.1 homeodomain-like protein [Vibrio phage 1.261.O._10N.286.51.A7]AUR93665.1 homeodomain-like protein [Vibrio phage 1.188.B._10N.286.51.A6]AUR93751.1 homeodomain-like protein [Vibrio phage 1.188.C._10N.286.51.A6]AUR92050.1 homeodomain-like protein [Vibrio phage 1.169